MNMMMTYNQLREKWNSIKKGDSVFCLVDQHHHVDINIGYTNLSQKTLLIRNTGTFLDIPSSRSIIAENYQLDNNTWILSFRLIDPENEEVFIKLCCDIIESSRDEKDNVVEFIVGRYLKWQRLLEFRPLDILSSARQKGLIGELLYLQKLIPVLGAEGSVLSWSGPEWSDHDFVYDNTWAEIKTVHFSASQVTISSLEQLDNPANISLLVVYFIEKTTQNDESGLTLTEIVNQTRKLIGHTNKSIFDFERKLCEYGYSGDKTEYNVQKYLIGNTKTYEISNSFPKLLRSSIHPAIISAKYTLSFAAVEDFQIKGD